MILPAWPELQKELLIVDIENNCTKILGAHIHKNAIVVYDDWEYERYECPDCGITWKEYWDDKK